MNISRFGSKIVGIGGFINISQNAKRVVFSGTFTSGGLEIRSGDGTLRVEHEGKHRKFVSAIEQICYNAEFAEREGRAAIFVTERAVFRAVDGTLELVEVAPGIDMDQDIFPQMAFRPRLAPNIERMDARLFRAEPMGLLSNLKDDARSPRGHAGRPIRVT